MRIILLTSGYRPQIGGLQTAVESLAKTMQNAGQIILVVTNRNPRRLLPEEIIDGVKVLRLQFLYPRLSYLSAGRFDLYIAGIFFLPVTFLKLLLVLLRFRPDVVNQHYVGSPSLFLLLVRIIYKYNWIVSLHGGDVEGEPKKNRFNRWLFCSVLRSADKITACSAYLSKLARDFLPPNPPDIRLIPNGVNTDLFSIVTATDRGRPYLCAIGQLEVHKGFDVVINAFELLKDEYDTLDLLIGGIGSQMSSLADQIAGAHLASRVQLLGRLDQREIASLMRGSCAIVIPSRRESFGIVALEGRCTERPIIASRVGGLEEALNGYPVRWVLPGDVAGLAEAIREEMIAPRQHDDLWRKQNQDFLDKCSWSKISDEYLNEYVNLT